MVQAARSGRQNIAEGSQASGTSKKFELKLVGVARASLEELLLDYEDFLRQRGFVLWGKDHPTAQLVRHPAYEKDRTYMTIGPIFFSFKQPHHTDIDDDSSRQSEIALASKLSKLSKAKRARSLDPALLPFSCSEKHAWELGASSFLPCYRRSSSP